MRSNTTAIIVALMVSTLLASGAVWAATQDSNQPMSQQQKTADKDFGKLSSDGSLAFQDLTLTRLAIFDGRIDDAKKFVHEADTDFNKAKTDESVFTKAEADLKSPKDKAAAQKTADDKGQNTSSATDMKTPVAWLPVDGVVSINEDYTLNPTKTAAVADADKSLKSGDRKGAMEKLKLAHIDTDVVFGVLPVAKTLTAVHQAAQLIDSGKYYEGSQMLKQAQDNERFDVADFIAMPNKTAASNSDHTNMPEKDMPAK